MAHVPSFDGPRAQVGTHGPAALPGDPVPDGVGGRGGVVEAEAHRVGLHRSESSRAQQVEVALPHSRAQGHLYKRLHLQHTSTSA